MRLADRASSQREKWVAGGAGAQVLEKCPFPLRVELWTGKGAGFPLPILGTQLPSLYLPCGQAMAHWELPEAGCAHHPGNPAKLQERCLPSQPMGLDDELCGLA